MIYFKNTIDNISENNEYIANELIQKYKQIEKNILNNDKLISLFDTFTYCRDKLHDSNVHRDLGTVLDYTKTINAITYSLNTDTMHGNRYKIDLTIPCDVNSETMTCLFHILRTDIRYETNYGWGQNDDDIHSIILRSNLTEKKSDNYMIRGIADINNIEKSFINFPENLLFDVMNKIKTDITQYVDFALNVLESKLNANNITN